MNLEKNYIKDRAVMVEKAALEMMYNPEVGLGLKDLDNFEGGMLLTDQRKVDILGCVIGVKPATMMTGWLETGEFGNEVELGKIISRLGLKWSMGIRPMVRKLEVEIFAARDKETLDQLKEISQQSPKDIRKLAKLQGYPETGVEVILGMRRGLDEKVISDLVKEDPAYMSFFIPPVLSRDNYRREVRDYSRILFSSTKKNLPKTYDKALNRWDKIRNN